MRRTDDGDDVRGPDLTPMIDVVFLLLIFFLTTLSFRVIEGKLPTHLPRDVGPNVGPPVELLEPLEITITHGTAGPRVRVGRWILKGSSGVAAAVLRARGQDPDVRGRLEVDPGIDYDTVISVVDGCLLGGMRAITFAGG